MLSGLIWMSVLILHVQPLDGSQCQGQTEKITATAKPQVITSPNYPNNYPDSELCRWVVLAEKDTDVVRFMVADLKIMQSSTCSEDSVEVRDGAHHWNRLMRRWCGQDIPVGNTTSSGNAIFVKFRTDETRGDSGFKLLFWTVPKEDDQYSEPDLTTVNHLLFGATGLIIAIIFGGICISALAHQRQRSCVTRTAPMLKANMMTTRVR